MSYDEAIRKYVLHLRAACVGIITIGVLLIVFEPFEVGTMEALMFLFIATWIFCGGIARDLYFSGYGVSKEINALLEEKILPEFELVWDEHAPQQLVKEWLNSVAICVSILAVGTLLPFLPSRVLHVTLVFSAGGLLGLLGRVYIWFAANRRLRWYASEVQLRAWLDRHKKPKGFIETAVERAKEKGLLIL